MRKAEPTGKTVAPDCGPACKCYEGLCMMRTIFNEYVYSVENVREFAEFCLASGGFSIW